MKLKYGIFFSVLLLTVLLFSCGQKAPGEINTEIITAKEALSLISDSKTVLVDARNFPDYSNGHIEGAVNISRADIVVNTPYINMLAPAEQIEELMGRKGIDNSMLIVVYDNNDNMDSARLWWTLKYYGNDNVKVVSGGLNALLSEGAKVSDQAASREAKTYGITEERKNMIAVRDDLRELVDNPRSEAVIIDTRSQKEYEEGTIPGSILLDYKDNNFSDGTYKTVQQIRIRYLQEKIDYDKDIYMYCKTSIRGAQTYLALYNAGYRNLKLYDGAWVEWIANPMNPVFKPEKPVYMINSSDNS